MSTPNTAVTARYLVCSSVLALGCGKIAAAEQTPSAAPSAVRSAQAAPAAPETTFAVGTPAPDVTLVLQDGFALSLRGLKGKVVVLFFCARSEEPACLATARGFGAEYRELYGTHRIVLVGVSGDSAETHRAVLKREKLPFDFASDLDGRLARAFGVPAHPERPLTLVVGRDATIRAVWSESEPAVQAPQILAAARVPVPGELAAAE